MRNALAGRRVVVTRAAEQADVLAELLERHEAVPVVVPLIRIVPEPTGEARLAALDPTTFDWLIVTSPNGADAYLHAHRTSPAQVAAVGVATGVALESGGVLVTLVPHQQRATGLLAELPHGPGRVLVVQAVDAEPTLAEGLAEMGWQVTVVAPYRSVPTTPDDGLRHAALTADAVLFASGSAARAWVTTFGAATPPVVVAIGPQTAAAVERAGLKVTVVAADHSLSGMVAALDEHLGHPHRQ